MKENWISEISQGKRFRFGKNWTGFLSTLDDDRIIEAEQSLKRMLCVENLENKSFIDIGSGSGLFSLAARRLGASVHSIDFDTESVKCTKTLRSRYYNDDDSWQIEEGSILDDTLVARVGEFDFVYSWGVLHHTGDLWHACENAGNLVRPYGSLFIAIYNDRNFLSRFWLRIKRTYCSGFFGKTLMLCIFVPKAFFRTLFRSLYHQQNLFRKHKRNRGMSIVHDWIDWIGGLPYEYATVEEICHFFWKRGFTLTNLTTTNDLGCNQFVFTRDSLPENALDPQAKT